VAACAGGCTNTGAPPPAAAPAPVYQQTVQLEGLEQSARLVKNGASYLAHLDDGRVVSLPELRRLDAAAAHARFGALAPPFARQLATLPGERVVPAALFFDIDVDWASLTPRLASTDAAARKQAQRELQKAIARGRGQLDGSLRGGDIAVDHGYDTIPLVLAHARVSALTAVARRAGVNLMVSAQPLEPQRHAAAKNGVTDPGIDRTWNANNQFGAGQRIAHIEDSQAGLYDNHEAFAQAETDSGGSGTLGSGYHVTYQVEPRDCSDWFDCPDGAACVDLGHAGHKKQCVTMHASECMSVAAGSNDGKPFGAGLARYYYPNRGDGSGQTNMCNPAGLLDAYDWLVANDVTTVNESFGCQVLGDARSLEGIVEDWYARHFSIAISKSAGNQASGEREAACPYTLNSTCVGATELGGGSMACYSSWTNLNGSKGERSDREEPDVATFGGTRLSRCGGRADVDVIDCDGDARTCAGTSDWGGNDGTSFAAPQVAAMTALCKETAGGSLDALTMRALLKASSWGRNPSDFRYSESSTLFTAGNDWRDGGGGLIADPLRFACGGGGDTGGAGVKSGHDDGDLSNPKPWPFKQGDCASCNRNDPPLGGQSLHPQSDTPPGNGDGPQRAALLRHRSEARRSAARVAGVERLPRRQDRRRHRAGRHRHRPLPGQGRPLRRLLAVGLRRDRRLRRHHPRRPRRRPLRAVLDVPHRLQGVRWQRIRALLVDHLVVEAVARARALP
jgi:hypothetical protein